MMSAEMCALRTSPRLTVFRPLPVATPRPSRPAGPRWFVPAVSSWQPLRRRSPWAGALRHCALLLLVGTALRALPFQASPLSAAPIVSPAWLFLAERPRVALEPFGLWWSLMGNPPLVFADPTLDYENLEEALAEAAAEETVEEFAVVPKSKTAVPFRTQLDGSRFAGANCGPASLGMILEAFGISKPTDELRYRSHTYQGTWGSMTGTALQHLARVAEDFGVPTRGLYDGWGFRRWSIAELREEVQQGHPVMILTKYRLLPGHEGSRATDDHYIVLWDVDGDDFIYNDPAFTRARDGYARRISASQLERATRSAVIPGQAVAFLPPKQ
jgi:hypothetical protein